MKKAASYNSSKGKLFLAIQTMPLLCVYHTNYSLRSMPTWIIWFSWVAIYSHFRRNILRIFLKNSTESTKYSSNANIRYNIPFFKTQHTQTEYRCNHSLMQPKRNTSSIKTKIKQLPITLFRSNSQMLPRKCNLFVLIN